jgi:transcriptional regulator with XRE-family HTH domain
LRLGLSQQRLALLIDLEEGRDRISQWENGSSSPMALTLEHIAEAVGGPGPLLLRRAAGAPRTR